MMVNFFARILKFFFWLFDLLAPFGDLIVRIWVAQIFFKAGMIKLQSWDSTISLFENVYHVPFLSPYVAAVLGTGAELILPVLLVLGLGGRIMIFVFFMYNAVAVISYDYLWTTEGALGLAQHINWGLLLMMLMFHGLGKLSLDHLIRKKYGHLLK